MKNNDYLFSDIQNLCNAVSDWLIQKIKNPIATNETISCACCHIVTRTHHSSNILYMCNMFQFPVMKIEKAVLRNE